MLFGILRGDETMQTADNLSEGLLEWGSVGSDAAKNSLVARFRKEVTVIPICDSFSDLTQHVKAFRSSQMDISIGLLKVLPIRLNALDSFNSSLADKKRIPRFSNPIAAVGLRECFKTLDLLLLDVSSC